MNAGVRSGGRILVGNNAHATLVFTLDRTPPAITIAGVAEGALVAGPVSVTATASDAHATTVIATLDGAPYALGSAISADGAHTIVATATDAAGNTTTATRNFAIDAIAPVLSLSGVVDGALVKVAPAVQLDASDAHLATVSASLDGVPLSLSPVIGTSFSALLSAVTTDGPHTYSASATDSVGRVTTRSLSFTLDATPPAITIVGVAEGALVAGPVSITVSVSDAHSTTLTTTLDGVPYVQGTSIVADGTHTLVASATDAATNATTVTRHFTIDAVAPTLSLTGVSEGALVNTAPTIALDAADAHLSSVTATRDGSPLSLPPVTGSSFAATLALVSADGSHTYTATATDSVGRSTSRSLSFTLDATPPTVVVNGVTEGALVAGPVSLTVNVTDASSTALTLTLDGAPYVQGTPITSDGPHALVASATDAATNNTTVTRHFTIDAVAPTMALTGVSNGALVGAAPAITLDAFDAHLASVTANLDGAPLSVPPVSGPSFSTTLTPVSSDGLHSYTATATDSVGRSTARFLSFTLDATSPTVTINGVAEGALVAGPVSLTVTVADAHPGTLTLTLDGAPYTQGTSIASDGAHTLLAHAVDGAGNATDKARHFTIDAVVPTLSLSGVGAGAYVNTIPTISVAASDLHLASVTARLNGSSLVLGAVTPPTFSATLTPVSVDGAHTYEATATDAVARSTTRSLSFTLDRVSPTITFSGVTNGATVPPPVSVGVSITDTNLDATKTVILLDGSPYTPGTTISSSGMHNISAHAEDRAGNAANAAIAFTIAGAAALEPNFPYTVCALEEIDLEDHSLVAGKPADPSRVSCNSSSDRPPHCSNALFGGNVASDDDVDLSKSQVLGSVLARGSVTLDRSRVDGDVRLGGYLSRDHKSQIGGSVLPLAGSASLCTCGPSVEDLITDRSTDNDNVRLLAQPWSAYYDSQRKILTLPKNKELTLPAGRLFFNEVRLSKNAALLAPTNALTEITIVRPPDTLDLRAPTSRGGTFVVVLGGDRCDDDDDHDWHHHYSHNGHGHHHGWDHHSGWHHGCHDSCHDEAEVSLHADGYVSIFAPGVDLDLDDGTLIGRLVVRRIETDKRTYILDPTPTPVAPLHCEVTP